jgi:hypothetical protein
MSKNILIIDAHPASLAQVMKSATTILAIAWLTSCSGCQIIDGRADLTAHGPLHSIQRPR